MRDWPSEDTSAQIAALTSRAEAAEAQRDEMDKLYRDAAAEVTFLRAERDTANGLQNRAEAQVAALRDALEWALDIIELNDELIRERLPETWAGIVRVLIAKAKARAALSSLPASPATEKLQARVKELEGALRPLVDRLKLRDPAVAVGKFTLVPVEDLIRAASALKGEG